MDFQVSFKAIRAIGRARVFPFLFASQFVLESHIIDYTRIWIHNIYYGVLRALCALTNMLPQTESYNITTQLIHSHTYVQSKAYSPTYIYRLGYSGLICFPCYGSIHRLQATRWILHGSSWVGPITPRYSLTGAAYILLVIDYFSRFTWAKAYVHHTSGQVVDMDENLEQSRHTNSSTMPIEFLSTEEEGLGQNT